MNARETITQKYLRRWPHSKRARQWAGRSVHIRTENGIWRPGGHGYTLNPGDAGVWPFEEACALVSHCGPEKQARFIASAPVENQAIASFDNLVKAAQVEAAKAMRKFPAPNYTISKVAEEAGEVIKAAIHCAEGRESPENLRGEMVQLVAMLYRLWVEGDQVHGLAPVCRNIDAGGA